MCTLIALHRVVPGAALVVGANRDECYDRPAEGPALRATPSGPIVAPLDLEARGTWFGLSRHGVFAALTNLPCPDPDPRRRSRGLLVLDALAGASAREAAEKLRSLPMDAYNPFNLFVADRDEAFAFSYERGPRPASLRGGACVIGNAPLDVPEPAKVSRLREQVGRIAGSGAPLSGLEQLCRDHAPGPRGPLDAVCVHTPSYGTRSSFLLSLAEAGLEDPRSVFRYAHGPPCESPYEDWTPLLRDLGRERPGVQGTAERGRAS